jgi:hypothetical protein
MRKILVEDPNGIHIELYERKVARCSCEVEAASNEDAVALVNLNQAA